MLARARQFRTFLSLLIPDAYNFSKISGQTVLLFKNLELEKNFILKRNVQLAIRLDQAASTSADTNG